MYYSNKFKAALLVLLLAVSLPLYAQKFSDTADYNNEKAVGNILMALNSENEGLRNSAVYFAGKYKIKEALLPLMELLRKSKEYSDKYLISLSLYKIGDERGMYLVKEQALSEENSRVKNMLSSVYNTFIVERNEEYVKE